MPLAAAGLPSSSGATCHRLPPAWDLAAEQEDGLPTRLQLCRVCMTFLGLLLFVNDPDAPGLGTGAGAGHEPPRVRAVPGAGDLGAQPSHHGRPQRQDGGAVDARIGWIVSIATKAHASTNGEPTGGRTLNRMLPHKTVVKEG